MGVCGRHSFRIFFLCVCVRSHGVLNNFERMFKNEEIVPESQRPDALEMSSQEV